ncbi:MAG: hypothetical protein JSS02_05230, partial [Planctomycetes bacterium]|nr:hypothetical protein [Planctomycetota bacterium]
NTDEEIQFDEIGQMEFRPNEKILIGGELVRLPDLQQVLESYQGQDRVFIFCSHDSDPAPNSVAVDVVQAILQMGLPLGYIPEASNTIHVAKERIRQTFRNGAAP